MAGAAAGAASAKGESQDDSKESPQAKEPDDPGKGLVAPEGAEQSELVLKKLQEVLNDPAKLKDLEQRDGISRSRIEQVARKFEKIKSEPAGPGREIKVKPGEQTAGQPTPNLPGLDSSVKFSTKTMTQRGSVPQDQLSNNFEGFRFPAPAELRGKLREYTKSIANVSVGEKPAAPRPKNGK